MMHDRANRQQGLGAGGWHVGLLPSIPKFGKVLPEMRGILVAGAG